MSAVVQVLVELADLQDQEVRVRWMCQRLRVACPVEGLVDDD